MNGYLSYRSRVWHDTARGGLPKIDLEGMDFEKYADMVIRAPLLFLFKKAPKGAFLFFDYTS